MASAFSIGVSGLKAAQIGMDVTSHNIANVNTPNYQRQVTEFKDVVYNNGSPKTPSGAGVEVANIKSVNDPFLINSYPKALSDSSEYDTLAGLAKPLDNLLNNPALNLSTAMQDTFNAFQDVADTPTSLPIRQNAIDKANTFAEKANTLSSQLNDLKGNLQQSQSQGINDINIVVKQLADVNKQLFYSGGKDANLMAQRDGLTFDLSKLTSIVVSQDKNTISTTSGKMLISGGINVTELKDTDAATITGGSVGGTNKFITTMLNPAIEKLPIVVKNVAEEINSQAIKGYDLNGNTGVPIFDTSGSGLKVSINDPKKLGASTSNIGLGDGTNAQAISDIRKKLIGGQTLQNQYSSIISGLDSKAKNYADMDKFYNTISDGIKDKIQSISGVNLDEEAANLLRYQQMYQANAKVIQTQNEMFGTLINIKA